MLSHQNELFHLHFCFCTVTSKPLYWHISSLPNMNLLWLAICFFPFISFGWPPSNFIKKQSLATKHLSFVFHMLLIPVLLPTSPSFMDAFKARQPRWGTAKLCIWAVPIVPSLIANLHCFPCLHLFECDANFFLVFQKYSV